MHSIDHLIQEKDEGQIVLLIVKTKLSYLVIAKPFPSFRGTVGVSFFSSNEIPKNVHGDAESCFVHHGNKIFNHHHPHP